MKKKPTYPNPWMYNGEPFETEDIGKYHGFVYCIVDERSGKKYIGRKYFYSIRKVPRKKRRQRSESNWKDYYGSSPVLSDEVKLHGKAKFRRYILSLHTTRGDCNYEEVRQQFLHNVLEDESFYNDNINGKWMRKPKHIVEARGISNTQIQDL